MHKKAPHTLLRVRGPANILRGEELFRLDDAYVGASAVRAAIIRESPELAFCQLFFREVFVAVCAEQLLGRPRRNLGGQKTEKSCKPDKQTGKTNQPVD